MTLQSSPSTSAGLLLAPENQVVCAKLSSLNTPDVSQRAAALILLDQGSTQAEAAEQSGLSIGQIRYLVKRFKEKGMEMFPADSLEQAADCDSSGNSVGEESATADAESSPETQEPESESSETSVCSHQEEQNKEVSAEKVSQKATKVRKKASKKRPKRPKPIKKKKSKRKRKKKRQG